MSRVALVVPRRARWWPPSFIAVSLALALGLVVASWGFVLFSDDARTRSAFSPEALAHAAAFVAALAGSNAETTPAFLRPERWAVAFGLAYETLAMSVLAIGFAGLGALATVMLAARSVAHGELSPTRAPGRLGLFAAVRALYVFARAVPELVWAMLIIFVFSPGILPGALALGLHNFGILGKLCAEVIEDLDPRPVRALRAAGASRGQILVYAVLPMALPQFLTYLLYRWEVVIRTTIVVGFVSAGGLGREFRLSMSFFHYTEVTLLLLVYVLLVVLVDLAAAGLRRLAR
jgi:phosphonate transport system permease protein